ncbi:PilW family protein [Francisella philomiragia]|uniref:PilW family protein n=1 Tax=Francisella philomiragia TaxID=28110 RepID=UPI001C9E11C8|nr:prepilin-type N-terminal cleavage/methylation domain-containing protein [Francisella philomiragia]MBY7734085.1 prepilin-type N-terminal cleavage/methylation domain-containing protein [Francisella philomiragia]
MLAFLNKRNKKGFTLTELLVATVIAVIALSALINTYMGVKHSYTEYKDKTTTEAKELLVKNFLYDFIKDVGFACNFGSLNQTYYDSTSDSLDNFFYSSAMIKVGQLPLPTSDHLSEALENGCSGECFKSGTDYIMIKKEESRAYLTQINSSSSELHTTSVEDISAGDYLFLCNKKHINLVKATSINSGSSIVDLSRAPQGGDYYPGDYVGKYSLQILYVRDSGVTDDNGQSIYSLYAFIKDSNSNGVSYELVRGVDNLIVELATVSNGNVTWNSVSTDIDVSASNYLSLKVSFDLDGQTFYKIINL